jgi:hypothetical protein
MRVIRYIAQTGETIDILPKSFKPFSYDELESRDEAQAPTYSLEIEASSIEGLADRNEPSGPGTVTIPITFGQPVSIFGLVEGGWLPLPFVQPAKFLVDRNVVASLVQIRRGISRPDLIHTNWWFEFFKDFSVEINAALYALEGNKRRTPTFDEFCHAFDEASAEIGSQLPGVTLTRYEHSHYLAAYALIIDFADRNRRETEFLIRIAPQVAERVADSHLHKIQSAILNQAKQFGLKLSSLVILTCLACLYERRDGSGLLAARRIIKPSRTYSEQDAHNALSDLRALELFASGLGLERESFALCTCDKSIAAFWSGLWAHSHRWENEKLTFTVSLSDALFPRLEESDRDELIELIQESS